MAAPLVCFDPSLELESLKRHIGHLSHVSFEALFFWMEHQRPGVSAADLGITERQLEVLRLVGAGLQAKEIAYKLRMSPRTAEFHRNQLMLRLGLPTTLALCSFASRTKLSEPMSPPSEEPVEMRQPDKPKYAQELTQELSAVKVLGRISEVCPSPTLQAYRKKIRAAEKELEAEVARRRRHPRQEA